MSQSAALKQQEAPQKAPERAITMRGLVIALGLLVLANIWMKYAALITLSSQVTMSVPPIPALMGLIALLALRAVLGPLSRWFRLSRRELLFIYVFLTLSVALTSGGALREFMPELTALQYFATPENGWSEFTQYQPAWLAPQDPEASRAYYEGTEAGVPWRAWLAPLGSWSLLFMLLLGGLLCITVLFYDEWAESEQLSFQVTELPLSLTAPPDVKHRMPQLWRDPVMWAGFALATLHNGLNISHAFNPSVPALGLSYHIGGLFTERPWSALNDLGMRHRPAIFGFGYLMPQEVVVSSVIFYALIQAESVVALALGYDIPRFPHYSSQAGGAFTAFGLVLIYMARKRLAQSFRNALSGQGDPRQRWAAWGLIVSLLGMWLWWRMAGMSTLATVVFLGLILLGALTYARVRAQAGLPALWAFPCDQSTLMITDVFGSKLLKQFGGVRNLTVFYMSWFLARGYLPNLSAYHFEGLHVARQSGIRHKEMIATLLLALVFGMAVSYWAQLDTYYAFGANFLEGGTHTGGTRVTAAIRGFTMLEDAAGPGIKPNLGKTIAILWGFTATIILTMLRLRFLRFPLHHLGFIIGTTRGFKVWGALLLVAIVKSLAVRIGGIGLYRRLIPGAIGVVLGHFVLAGGLWSIIAVFGGEAFRAYQVWFG